MTEDSKPSGQLARLIGVVARGARLLAEALESLQFVILGLFVLAASIACLIGVFNRCSGQPRDSNAVETKSR